MSNGEIKEVDPEVGKLHEIYEQLNERGREQFVWYLFCLLNGGYRDLSKNVGN